MNVNTYTPFRGSLAARLVAYFDANPDEQLSAADIGVKFEACAQHAYTALKPLVKAGVLAVENPGTYPRIWRAGPELPQVAERLRAAPDAEPPPPRNTKVKPPSVEELQATLASDRRIPRAARPRLPNYAGVWQAMEPGQSVTCPAGLLAPLMRAAVVWGRLQNPKRQFVSRVLESDTGAIWRDA